MEAAAGQVSPALVAELSATLGYEKLAQRIQRSGLTHPELLQRYLNVALLVQPTAVPRVCRDPDDDQVLACARAAGAELIVTGDADLLSLERFEDIPIRTPRAALEILAAAPR